MLASVIAQVVADSGFAPEKIEDVVVGCANQAGEDSRCIARHAALDRKSTRLNSSHVKTSYAVLCLKKRIAYSRCLYVRLLTHRHAYTSSHEWNRQYPTQPSAGQPPRGCLTFYDISNVAPPRPLCF